MLLGGAIGAAIGLIALAPAFIAGTGGLWRHPVNDFNLYLIAWHYFLADGWRFPLFDIPAMGYPEGGSILFNDALPLATFVSKVIHSLTGASVNPFGWWIFLTYVLQGALAVRLVRAAGSRSVWAAAAGALLAICYVPWMRRLGHTALSSHFVILWALAIYFESVRQGRLKATEMSALWVVTLLINTYLFVMVAILGAATAAQLWLRHQLAWRDVRTMTIGVLTTIAVGLVAGYGVVFLHPASMKAGGFGLYSWNLATLFVPPESLWGFPRGLVRDATGGQYEGDCYIGLGAVLLVAACAVTRPGTLVRGARRHAALVAAVLLLTAWAASNRIYFGRTLLLAYPLPSVLDGLTGFFRATGRFMWPLVYLLVLVPAACVARWWRPRIAVPLLLAASTLQIAEAVPAIRLVRASTSANFPDMVDSPRLGQWVAAHRRVWQYPSFACGGLAGSARVWGNAEANRELQVELLIARLGVPTNSVDTSRVLKDCAAEAKWADAPVLDDGVLYLIGREARTSTPPLAALTSSDACVNLDWATVCSRRWIAGR